LGLATWDYWAHKLYVHMMIAVLRFVEHLTPSIPAKVAAMRMSNVLIDMTQTRVRAVVLATKVSVPVSAAPKEKVVAVTRAVHQTTSVETAGFVVSFRVSFRIRLHRRRRGTVVLLELHHAVFRTVVE